MKKDIQLAYKAEQKYLKEGGDLVNMLNVYGYGNLEEYFSDKNDYLLKRYEFVNHYLTNDKDLLNRIKQSIINQEYGFWTLDASYTFACVGSDPIDYDLAEKLGVKVFDIGYGGGTIISSPKDVACLFMYPLVSTVDTDFFFNKLMKFLNSKSSKFIRDNNDVMFDGKKVIGTSELTQDKLKVFCIVASFNDNSEIIEKLCPPKVKKPGIIPGDILTKKELEMEIASWANLLI